MEWAKLISKCPRSPSSLRIFPPQWSHQVAALVPDVSMAQKHWQSLRGKYLQSLQHILFGCPWRYGIFIPGRWDGFTVYRRLVFFKKVSKLLLTKCWNKAIASHERACLLNAMHDSGSEPGLGRIAMKDFTGKVDGIWIWTMSYIAVLQQCSISGFWSSCWGCLCKRMPLCLGTKY